MKVEVQLNDSHFDQCYDKNKNRPLTGAKRLYVTNAPDSFRGVILNIMTFNEMTNSWESVDTIQVDGNDLVKAATNAMNH